MLRRLCVFFAATTLAGCGWFDSAPTSPLQTQRLRPGADKQSTTPGLPPAPQRGSYEGPQAPVDDTRNQPVGTIVSTKGGQKAQLEIKEKERGQREAERNRERSAQAGQTAQPAAPPSRPTSDR
jgi:hypothetical protein